MVFDWSVFGSAVVCLIIPIGLFHTPRLRYRPISRNWVEQWQAILSVPHHFIDVLRAALGAWLLVHSIHAEPVSTASLTKYGPALVHAGVIMLGVLLQTLFCK